MIITDYYHQSIINHHQSIINHHPNQSLWLLICVNLCQSVVYKNHLCSDFILSTDYHRLFLGHGIPRLFQRHGLAPHRNSPRHFVVTACFASSRLSLFFCGNEPCLYFSIAFMQIKPFPCGAQPCLF